MARKPGTPWTDEEVAYAVQQEAAGVSLTDIASALGRGYDMTRRKVKFAKQASHATAPAPTSKDIRQASRQQIELAAEHPPVSHDDYRQVLSQLRVLESKLARLTEQKKWETHSESEAITGGVVTLRESDRHNGDENHLLSCTASLEEKFCALLQRYEPDRIQHIGFDDWIAGRGIFKEQDLQMAVSDPNQQIVVGAMKARKFYLKIREITQAPIKVFWLRGNHEYVQSVSLTEALFDKVTGLCSDIPNLTFQNNFDRAIVNLADKGFYNVLAMHGFGHSKISPNSPALIDTAKDILIKVQQHRPPEQHIHRVMTGHTHWASSGLERIPGVHFDTTGGLQRNNRVKLGMNQRPLGWMVYISPRGMESDIAQPIQLQPDSETFDREMTDDYLKSANRQDCAELLTEYGKILKSRGLLADSDEFGVKEGRW